MGNNIKITKEEIEEIVKNNASSFNMTVYCSTRVGKDLVEMKTKKEVKECKISNFILRIGKRDIRFFANEYLPENVVMFVQEGAILKDIGIQSNTLYFQKVKCQHCNKTQINKIDFLN